jgi:hypothetical protein
MNNDDKKVVNTNTSVNSTNPNTTPVVNPVQAVPTKTNNTAKEFSINDKNRRLPNGKEMPTEAPTQPVIDTVSPGLRAFKRAVAVIFLLLLIAFVAFLPDITQYVVAWKAKQTAKTTTITDGYLDCTRTTTSETLDYNYEYVINFTNSKITDSKFISTVKGSATKDSATLTKIYDKCETLYDAISELEGVMVECDNDTTGSVIVTEKFDYNKLDFTKTTAAYAEAGGTYTNFQADEDVDVVKKALLSSGYTCKKASS